MIKPISIISNNSNNISYKSNLNKIQNEIDSYTSVNNSEMKNNSLSCIAALILTVLAIGATITTAIKAGKDKQAKQAIENLVSKDSLKINTNGHLNILK